MTIRGAARLLRVGREDSDAIETARVHRLALDALEAGVVVLDGRDQVLFSNQAARSLGVIRADGQVDSLILPLVAKVRRKGRPRGVELDVPRAVGSFGARREPCGVNVRAVAVEGDHIVIEVADVTEAHRLARVRRDFVANVSHELKTPVGALRLLAEALLEATGSQEASETLDDPADVMAVRRFAGRIKHESTRLGRLVGDLLELTRLQGADPLPEPEPVPLGAVLAEVVDRTSTAAAAKGIEVVVMGEEGLTIHGSEAQLRTALANLIENAVAYSSGGTQVTIATGSEGDVVSISVTDQGIGIEEKDLDRIFERFYRADKARSRVTGGTGLGLAIVKHIATNHGGRVDVTSEIGKGSMFTLRLPACPEPGGGLVR